MSNTSRIDLLRRVHEWWKRKRQRKTEGAMATNKTVVGRCEVCGKEGVKVSGSRRACSMCVNLLSNINQRPELVARLYQEAYPPSGPGRVENVCDPDNCEELRDAIRELLAVQKALGAYAPGSDEPGALAGAVELAVRAAHEPTVLLDKYDGTLAKIGGIMARTGMWGDGCMYEDLPDMIRHLVDKGHKVPDGYWKLMEVFLHAVNQAARGKGKDRHATDEPFERQPTMRDARELGIGFPIGQARKKALEAVRLDGGARIREMLGAINYLAMAVIVDAERLGNFADSVAGAELPEVEYAEGGGHD